MPTKQEVLDIIQKAANEKAEVSFDMSNLPADLSIEELATTLKTLTGKNTINALKNAQQAQGTLSIPFDTLSSTQVTPSITTANASMLPEQPFEAQEELEAPSMGERFKAGLHRKELTTNPTGFDEGDIAQFAGENIGPGIGAAVGALSTAPTWLPTGMSSAFAGSVAGAAAGRAAQTALTQDPNEPKSVGSLVIDPIVAGAGQALGEGVINKVAGKSFGGIAERVLPKRTIGGFFKAASKAKPTNFDKLVAGILHIAPGIPKEDALSAARNPGQLWGAKSMEEAQTLYGKFLGKMGSKEVRAKAYTGSEAPSPARIRKLVEWTEDLVKQKNASAELLITAHEQIQHLMQMGKMGDPKEAALAKYWGAKLSRLAKLIEKQKPGYKAVRKMYDSALLKKVFESPYPLLKDGTADMTKIMGTMAAAVTSGKVASSVAPLAGAAAALSPFAVSPYVAKGALHTLAGAQKVIKQMHYLRLPQSVIAATYRELLKQAIPEDREKLKKAIVQEEQRAFNQPTLSNDLYKTPEEVQMDMQGILDDQDPLELGLEE